MKNFLLAAVLLLITVFGRCHGRRLSAQILEGRKAVPCERSFQSLIIIKKLDPMNATAYSYCGGSILNEEYIVTAAHCCDSAVSMTLYVGLTSTNDGTGVFYYTVKNENDSMLMHPYYDRITFRNDICLVKVNGKIPTTDQIKPIALPYPEWEDTNTFNNRTVTVSGWGQTYKDEDSVHPDLMILNTTKIPQDECVKKYENTNKVTSGAICARGACHGDSGGPLTIVVEEVIYLLGLVSWGVGPCDPSNQNPVVFVNMPRYLYWICSITGIPIKTNPPPTS